MFPANVWRLLPVALSAAALLATSVPASGQTRAVRMGESVSGRLAASDPKLDDNSHFHLWTYSGAAGDELLITLRSPDFDAYLEWGTLQDGKFTGVRADDDSGGGTDAMVRATVGAGPHAVRVNTLFANTTGDYTLVVQRAAASLTPSLSSNRPIPIALGETRSGRLESGDMQLEDGSYYDLYLYNGQPGERIMITMRSTEIDAYLIGGPLAAAATSVSALQTDDDGAGGTDARLVGTLGPDGVFAIHANAYGEGETGAYTLTVQAATGSATAPSRPAETRVIRAGDALTGRLTSADPKQSDGTHYHHYTYAGRAGETLRITLTSADFDAYLGWGRLVDGRPLAQRHDDDSAGGTNARLVITLEEDGLYYIEANTVFNGEMGGYTLSVEAVDAAASAPRAAPPPQMVRPGQTVQDRLDHTDALSFDNSYYKAYTIQGRPGEQLRVTLRSSAFDAYLQGGRMEGTAFIYDKSDDDSAGGKDAQFVVTLGSDGTYTVQANTLFAGETGAFTLTIEPVGR